MFVLESFQMTGVGLAKPADHSIAARVQRTHEMRGVEDLGEKDQNEDRVDGQDQAVLGISDYAVLREFAVSAYAENRG